MCHLVAADSFQSANPGLTARDQLLLRVRKRETSFDRQLLTEPLLLVSLVSTLSITRVKHSISRDTPARSKLSQRFNDHDPNDNDAVDTANLESEQVVSYTF